MKKVETYGRVTGGKLHINYRDRFNHAIASMPDGRVTVRVERCYRKRSTDQNAYYWGVIVNECQEGVYEATGQMITKEEAHYLLKSRCNPIEMHNTVTGEVAAIGGSTTEMSTVQMSEYWLRCNEFILEYFGRTVPAPNEQMEIWHK